MKNFKIIICLLLMIISNYAFAQNKKLDQMTERDWIEMKAMFSVFSKLFETQSTTPKTEIIQTPIYPWDYAIKYKSNGVATLDSLSKSMEYNLSDTWGKTDIKIYNYFPMSISKEQAELYCLNVLKSSIVKNDYGDTIKESTFSYRSYDKYKSNYFSRRASTSYSTTWDSNNKTEKIYHNEKDEPINSEYNLTSTIPLGESIIEPKGFLDIELKYVTGYHKILVSKKDVNKTFILNNISFKILDTNATGIVLQCNDFDKMRYIPLNSKLKPFVANYSGEKGFENANIHTSTSSSTQQYETYLYFNKNKDTSMATFKKYCQKMEEVKQNPKLKKDVVMLYFDRKYAYAYFYMPIYTTRKLKLNLK